MVPMGVVGRLDQQPFGDVLASWGAQSHSGDIGACESQRTQQLIAGCCNASHRIVGPLRFLGGNRDKTEGFADVIYQTDFDTGTANIDPEKKRGFRVFLVVHRHGWIVWLAGHWKMVCL